MNKGAKLRKNLQRWISSYGLFQDVAFSDEQEFARFFGLDPMSAYRRLKELRLAGFCRTREDGKLIVAVQDWSRTAEPLVDAIPVAVNEAFQQEDVTINIEAFTGETFLEAMKEELEKLKSGKTRLRSLHIRLLVPNFKKPVAVPSVVGDPDDLRARERQDEISQDVITLLRDIKNLQTDDYGRYIFRVTVEIGRLDYFTPWDKIFVFNGRKVLKGKYEVVQVQEEYRGKLMKINDFRGFDVPMSTSEEESLVWETIKQFEDKWKLAEVVEL
ncbi:hypothetical protein MK805_07295 [Shimazuella sp. AN120528]|uniref:hypothetical protein n=1 Tax=Shimazuella soli TaxID=1892854 RepID=UPI001F0CE06D|nr:hypothetical protein [Shimazuella soli]MCH5584776.1 hypothetical protein [Shimazuella soli]